MNYVSNAKPTGVYPWNTQPPSNYATPQFPTPQFPTSQFPTPQFPTYLPSRPQKPYRPNPKPSIPNDSKITHLGSYLFNGRPENIYMMPPYHNPYASPYHHMPNPYQAIPSPYNSFSPYYAPPAIPNYY